MDELPVFKVRPQQAAIGLCTRVTKMDELPEVLTRLNTRLNALENRVALLEHPSEALAALPAPPASASPEIPAIASPSFTQTGAIFPVLGRAMLGMAGAYALRAVAESGSFP